MNRERDFDRTLRRWLDDGAESAPERFVWAALEDAAQTSQRGAWVALLEGTLMKLKPAAPMLGIAAVVVLAIAAFQLLGGNVGTPTQPSPTPRTFTSADLPNIVFTEANAPEGFTVDGTESGRGALLTPLRPGGEIFDLNTFVEGLMTNLNSTETGGYVSWSAIFETEADAEAAYELLATEHESDDGWGMERASADPGLGDESATFSGRAYDLFDTNMVHVWRVGNLLLAAVAVGDVAASEEGAAQLLAMAREMDDRVH
jgi:hypothetical protein